MKFCVFLPYSQRCVVLLRRELIDPVWCCHIDNKFASYHDLVCECGRFFDSSSDKIQCKRQFTLSTYCALSRYLAESSHVSIPSRRVSKRRLSRYLSRSYLFQLDNPGKIFTRLDSDSKASKARMFGVLVSLSSFVLLEKRREDLGVGGFAKMYPTW